MPDVRRLLLETKDRVAASDPGLGRLRQASSAAASVGTALPVQLGVAALLGYQGPVVFAATMFGAVVAMLSSNALVAKSGWAVVRTAVFFPLAVAAGLVPAILTGGERAYQVAGFAAVLFGAVWVRRFGTDWFFYGFMAWMGFFFATFLQATWAVVPELLLASIVSSAWVCLLASTVLYTNPRRVLHLTVASFFSRGRAVARAAAELLAVAPTSERRRARALRILSARSAGLEEAALLVDAWSADASAVPAGWSAVALRRRLIEAQQAMERVAGAALRLGDADPRLRTDAHTAVECLAGRRDIAALIACERLRRGAREVERGHGNGWWPARHLAYGVEEFLRLDATADDPPELVPGEADFQAASALAFGGLPGSAAVAKDVAVQGRWNPVARLSWASLAAWGLALTGIPGPSRHGAIRAWPIPKS